jgi:hypothetical protein
MGCPWFAIEPTVNNVGTSRKSLDDAEMTRIMSEPDMRE